MQVKLFVAISAIFIAFTRHVNVVDGLVCVGCIELDKLTFDKILAKFSIVLVKFDIAFPYGKKHDEYAKFALEISEDGEEAMDVAVSVVGIKNYGDKTNNELIDRFSIGDKLPVIKLFTNYNAKEWLDFPKDQNITANNLRQFVRRHTNLNIAVDDCLEQFDKLAAKFIATLHRTSAQSAETKLIVKEAEFEAERQESKKNQQIAQIYLLIMRRIQERDIEFMGAERLRLQQLLDAKVSEQKKKEINQKLNILSAFNLDSVSHSRSEL